MRYFKTIICVLVVSIFVLVSVPALAGGDGYGSKPRTVTADGAAYAHPCKVTQILVSADGVNSVKVDLYDNATAASGTRLAPPIYVKAGDYFGGAVLPNIIAENGVYVDITTDGSAIVTVYTVPR